MQKTDTGAAEAVPATAAVGTAPPDLPFTVHQVATEHRGRFAHATCSTCAWRGPARRAIAVAERDGDLHRLT